MEISVKPLYVITLSSLIADTYIQNVLRRCTIFTYICISVLQTFIFNTVILNNIHLSQNI